MKQGLIALAILIYFKSGLGSVLVPNGNDRIVGGEEATPHEFPFVVRIEGSYSCSGVILDENYVLTSAGPCVSLYSRTVLASAHDTAKFDGTETRHEIVEQIEHPKFDSRTWNFYDIGILKVSPPFRFNENIQPANITWESSEDPNFCTVCGWGITSNSGGDFPTTLRKVDVPFVPLSQCENHFYFQKLTDDMVCYGDGQKSACRGDIGSPLICGGNVRGIFSWNEPYSCGLHPDVYTRVSSYKKYIDLQTVYHPEDIRPVIRSSECGGLLDGTSGSIIMKNIEPNVWCLWGIRMPLANGRFRLLSANLKDGASIYLTTRDGQSTRVTEVGVNYNQPGPLYYITFWSGTSGVEGRFEMEFYGNGYGDRGDTLDHVDYVGGGSTGTYSYPVGGGNYSSQEDSIFLVQGTPGGRLLFPEFDLEQSFLCENDKLGIYSWGTNSFLLRTVNCGTTPPLPVQSTSGLYLIHLTSNFRDSGSGFTLSWVP